MHDTNSRTSLLPNRALSYVVKVGGQGSWLMAPPKKFWAVLPMKKLFWTVWLGLAPCTEIAPPTARGMRLSEKPR